MSYNFFFKYQYLAANKSTYLAIKLNYQFRFYSIPIPFFSSPIPPKNLSVVSRECQNTTHLKVSMVRGRSQLSTFMKAYTAYAFPPKINIYF